MKINNWVIFRNYIGDVISLGGFCLVFVNFVLYGKGEKLRNLNGDGVL